MKPGTVEFLKRLVSGLVLAAAVLAVAQWNPLAFTFLALIAGAVLMWEWIALTNKRHWGYYVLGLVYIGAAMFSLIFIRAISLYYLYALFVLVWTSDCAAYFTGKLIGRHLLAPRISPKKTWEGLVGAVFFTTLAALYLLYEADDSFFIVPAFAIGLTVTVVGLLGDLFESVLKRQHGVKDSGKLIPGHGGLFDRLDALMPCAILAALVLYIWLHLP